MKRIKVTQDLLDNMKEARKSGATLVEIMNRFGVSKYVVMHYLKDTIPVKGIADVLWKRAEDEAQNILRERGFSDIVNLNLICPNGYFDILATKDDDKWLIDVTINESKDLATKSIRVIPEYRCAILYISHDLKSYRLMELTEVKL